MSFDLKPAYAAAPKLTIIIKILVFYMNVVNFVPKNISTDPSYYIASYFQLLSLALVDAVLFRTLFRTVFLDFDFEPNSNLDIVPSDLLEIDV